MAAITLMINLKVDSFLVFIVLLKFKINKMGGAFKGEKVKGWKDGWRLLKVKEWKSEKMADAV